jgi:glutathione synthase/RimK-type ligase-like ATP-grasp enzyme
MIIGIHPDRIGEESYSEKWAEFLLARGAEVRTLNLLAPDALEQARQCDGVMWRWAHNPQDKQSAQRILYTIEHYLGIPVYPDSPSAWHYDEKVAQFYLLQALRAPMPQTWLFWHRDQALAWARAAPYPVVFKLSPGASSANVIKVDTEAQAVNLINRAFRRGIFPMTMNEHRISLGFPRSRAQAKAMLRRLIDALRYVWRADYPALSPAWWKPELGYVYFQEFLPGNAFDTRISVIGNRAFGFRRMNRPNDFRASGSGNLVFDPDPIDRRCIEIASRVSQRGKFQSMAYDFLFKNGEPVICEISYAYADWAVHSCPGHWDPNLNWVEGQMWPEEAQVEDFLARVKAAKGSG